MQQAELPRSLSYKSDKKTESIFIELKIWSSEKFQCFFYFTKPFCHTKVHRYVLICRNTEGVNGQRNLGLSVPDDVIKLWCSFAHIQRNIECFQNCAKTWKQTQWRYYIMLRYYDYPRKSFKVVVSNMARVACITRPT